MNPELLQTYDHYRYALAAAPTASIVLIQGNPFQPPVAVSPAAIAAAVRGLSSALPVAHQPE